MTHPFHPWCGRDFPFVELRRNWGQDRVFFFVEDGTLASLPRAWTDLAEPDVFVAVSAGRSAFRVEDLLVLVAVAGGLGRSGDDGEV